MPSTALRLAAFGPVAVIAVYVAGVTPQVPLLDDWALAAFAQEVASGDAGLRAWLAPHNGSHIFVVPRLLYTAISFATSGSGRALVLASVAAIAWTVFVILRLGDHAPAATATRRSWLNLATALLLCSPVSYRAFIWPADLGHFVMNALVVTAAYAVLRVPPGSPPRAFVPALVCCALASITRSEGVAVWVVLAPLVVATTNASPERGRVALVWGCGFTLCLAIVTVSLVGLAPESARPVPRELLAHPALSVGHALGLAGMPFGAVLDPVLDRDVVSPRRYVLFGIPVVLGFLYWGWHGLRSREIALRRATLAWLGVGAFGGLFVTVAAVSRIGVLERPLLGDVWPGAYSVTAGLFGVATLQLAALQPRPARVPRWVAASLLALVLGLLAGAWATRGPQAMHHRWRSSWSPLCWELYEHLAPLNACFVGKPGREDLRVFETLGFRTIRSDVSMERTPDSQAGTIERVAGPGREPNEQSVEGWVAPRVDGEPPIVWLELVRVPGLFTVARTSSAIEGRVPWRADLPTPPGGSVVHAWVYERHRSRLVRLEGQIELVAPR